MKNSGKVLYFSASGLLPLLYVDFSHTIFHEADTSWRCGEGVIKYNEEFWKN